MSISGFEKIVEFRRKLHQYAELSGFERATSKRLEMFLEHCKPDELITGIGGYGIMAVYKGKTEGKTLMFRTKMDALPIREGIEIDHRSKKPIASHKCGHDGHMAILAGLALHLQENRPEKGTICLLFQPSGESGEGAKKIIGDSRFQKYEPDCIFGFLDMSGYEKDTVIVGDSIFAAASIDFNIKLQGKTAPVIFPEKGGFIIKAVAETLDTIIDLPHFQRYISDTFSAVRHSVLDKEIFGTVVDNAQIKGVMRAFHASDLVKMQTLLNERLKQISDKQRLTFDVKYSNSFPAARNSIEATGIITEAANKNSLKTIQIERAFHWSEDFGVYTQLYEGSIFGIGSGVDYPQTHTSDYEFPEEIISTAMKMYHSLIDLVLNQ